jgi:hypothetical protein
MKVAFMGELESAIAEWVSKNDKHGRGFVGQEFTNKMYPFPDIETAIDNLLAQGVLVLDDGYLVFKEVEDDAPESYPKGIQHMLDTIINTTPKDGHGGFSSQLLDHVSNEYKAFHTDQAVPDYIKAVMTANEKNAADSASEINMTKVRSALEKLGVDTDKNPAVHSPSHYTRGGIETIDFIEAKGLNFHLGNTVKYVSRAGFKQDALLQDLEKALWYLTREINRLKTQEP